MGSFLDPAALDRLRAMTAKGPPGALQPLVATFLANAPKLIAEMEAAARDGKAEVLGRAAHTLKSNAASFGAKALSEMCRELEALGRSGSVDGADERIARIQEEYDRVRDALAAWQAEQ